MGKNNVLGTRDGLLNTGTYDLLQKNCNSFSDCALFFLLGKRLDTKYRSLEKRGKSFPSVMKSMGYEKNDKADGFDVEEVILGLDPKAVFKKTEGKSLGGENVKSD